jgi:hypothetical protein
MDKEMTYYWKSDIAGNKVIARSYFTSNGVVFDEGAMFDTKDPVSRLNDFFVQRHCVCENIKELKAEIRSLKLRCPEIITTKEMYR